MANDNRASIQSLNETLSDVTSLAYAKRDIEALLAYSGGKMLAHLIEVITQQYRASCTDVNDVPPVQIWPLATSKAYEVFIPLCEAWLAEVKTMQDNLVSQTNTYTM